MELKEKVAPALEIAFHPGYIVLNDDEGISGYVVSPRFRRVTPLNRQRLIEKALNAPAAKLSKSELRRILAIAPLTPLEYDALGAQGDDGD